MKTIVLPGYSIKNKYWAYEVESHLSKKYSVIVHEWEHWKESSGLGSGLIIDDEVKRIAKYFQNNERMNIVAKSIGTMICMSLLEENKNNVNKTILCGIPLNDLRYDDFMFYGFLRNCESEMIVVYQNDKDPHGSYKQVSNFVGKINPKIDIIKKPSDTHDYPYYEDFAEFLGV